MAAAKLKRRSNLMPNGNISLNETPMLEDPVEDEESERKIRMKLQKRQSIGHGTPMQPKEESSAAVNAISKCSQAELAQMYSDCIKLSAENKISTKNAFNLNLIDYMAEVVRTKKSSEMDNFQSASCALDASTKIYAYRVDSVHADTVKLAGGVGDTKEEKANGNAPENDEDNLGDNADDFEKKKVKRKKRATTVEKNLNNIDIQKFDLEFDVDPLFKKTSAQFDSGSGGGQFLCNLFIRDEGCQLLLDSEDFLKCQSQPLRPEDCEDLQEDLVKIEPPSDEQISICPSFSKFSFKSWSIENEDPEFLNLSLHKNDADESLKLMDDDGKKDDEDNEHVFDVNAPPMEDFNDDSNGGAFMNFDDDNDNQESTEQPKRGLGMELVASMKQRLTSVPNEYSYFDDGRLGAWAGPKHWKFKPVSRSNHNFAVPGAPAKSKKSKDPLGPYNFEDLFNEEGDVWKSVEKTTKLNLKPVQLQNKTIDNWSEDKVMLPTDLHYKGKDFCKLFTTPELLVTNTGAVVQENVDDSINEYDFDNANDADDFCPNLPAEEDNLEPVDEMESGFPSQTMLPTQSQFDLLVSAPNRVEKLQIGYAKQAKKMDMRRLKAVEWNILQTSCLEQDKENDTDLTNEADKSNTNTTLLGSNVSFCQLYKNLTESNLMSFKMKENLSVPLAFVALLHLCNERTLALDGAPDLTDFSIAQS